MRISRQRHCILHMRQVDLFSATDGVVPACTLRRRQGVVRRTDACSMRVGKLTHTHTHTHTHTEDRPAPFRPRCSAAAAKLGRREGGEQCSSSIASGDSIYHRSINACRFAAHVYIYIYTCQRHAHRLRSRSHGFFHTTSND
jgi:hypothetical protein